LKLKKCPCGETPKSLFIMAADSADKYAHVSGIGCACGGEWEIEYNNNYRIGDDCMPAAIKAWSNAPRGGE
jgi:hypothetical protein